MNMLLKSVGAAALAAVAVGSVAQAELRQITIGTNPSGTIAFTLGSGLAKLFQQELGVRSAAQPFGGSSIYLPMLQSGDVTLGINNALDSGLAYRGAEPYSAPTPEVTTLGRLMRLEYGFFARGDSGIESMADLKGRKVVTRIKTNVILERVNLLQLETAGLSADDVDNVEAGGLGQGINAVVEGRADVAAAGLGIPALRKADASVSGGVRIIPLGDAATDEFMDSRVPGARVVMTEPSPRNVGVTEPIPVTGIELFVNAGAAVEEEDAYAMAKALYENWEQLQQEIPALQRFGREDLALPVNTMPYHPGAERFYREVGIWDEGRS